MIIYKSAIAISEQLKRYQQAGQTIGFVPTMGALHEGHLSLIAEAKTACTLTVCSIFVNPTQFNDPADYAKYPVTIEQDIDMLEKAGCDLLFLPSVDEIYPEGTDKAAKYYPLGTLETRLEGHFRPGHFQGVCRVVHRLLEIIHPDWMILGQKDYQQCMVLRRLLEITGLPTQLLIAATIREANGLAMSSRNRRLSATAREQAAAISRVLRNIREQLQEGELKTLTTKAAAELAAEGFRVEYLEIADAITLESVQDWDGSRKLVALAAAYLEEVRLIDNLPLN